MPDYVTITNAQVLPKAPVTSELMTALRDNPAAIAEGAVDAPVAQTGWHPYDMVNVGGSATGLIYSHAVDGSVATITSPEFESGYEYMFTFSGVGTSANPIRVDLENDSTGLYVTALTSTGTTEDGVVFTHLPRFSSAYHSVSAVLTNSGAIGGVAATGIGLDVVGTVRFAPDGGGTFASGIIHMYRRRVFSG